METKQWSYFAADVRRVVEGPRTDEPLELEFIPVAELGAAVARGEIAIASHLAVIIHAASRGLIRL